MKNQRSLFAIATALSALSFAPVARAQHTGSLRALSAASDRAGFVGCLGDRVSQWSIGPEGAPRVEWSRAGSCATGSVRVLTDGGALFIDPSPAARALVRLDANGAVLFRAALDSPVWGEPLLVDQSAVLRLGDGQVQWRSIRDGALQFYRRTEAAADPRAMLGAGSPVLVQRSDGSAVCVARAEAFECWSALDGRAIEGAFGSDARGSTSPALAVDVDRDGEDELLVAAPGGVVRAIARSGAVRWSRPSGSLVLAPPVAFYEGRTLLAAWADVDGWVHLVDARTGAARQGFPRRSAGASRVGVRVGDVDGDGALDLLVSERSGALSAFRVADGEAVVVREGPNARAPIDAEPLLVVTGDGVLHWLAIDGANALAHRPLAASALGTESAVAVGQGEARPVISNTSVEINSTVESQVIPARIPTPVELAAPAGCSTSPATTGEPRGWIALLLGALAVLRARKK